MLINPSPSSGIQPSDVEPLEVVAALHRRVVEVQQHMTMVRQIVNDIKIETEMLDSRLSELEKKIGDSRQK